MVMHCYHECGKKSIISHFSDRKQVQIVRVCLFPLLLSASFLFFVSDGEQIDVRVLDKTDQDDSKYVRCKSRSSLRKLGL